MINRREGFKLKPQQLKSLQHIVKKKNVLLALPTGAGKTLTFLAYTKPKIRRKWKTIVLSENNLIEQLVEDYDKFFIDTADILTLKGSQAKTRLKAYESFGQEGVNYICLNYHTAVNDINDLLDMIYDLQDRGYKIHLICDEIEVVRNTSSTFHKIVREISSACNQTIGLTASPSKGGLEEVQNILTVINDEPPISLDRFYEDFCKIEVNKILTYNYNGQRIGYPLRATAKYLKSAVFNIPLYVLDRTLKGAKGASEGIQNCEIHVNNSDYMLEVEVSYDLAGVIVFEYKGAIFNGYVSSSKKVKGFKNIKDYSKLVKSKMYAIAKSEIEGMPKFNLNKTVLKINKKDSEFKALQLVYSEYLKEKAIPYAVETLACVSPHILLYEYEADPKLKIKETVIIKRLLEDVNKALANGVQVVIFSKFTQALDYLELVIDQNHPFINYGVVKGGVKSADLKRYKDAYKYGDINTMLISEAGIRGLNLQTGGAIFCLDLPKTAGDLLQLGGRTSRIGAKHLIQEFHTYIIEDTVLKDFYNLVWGGMSLIKEYNPQLLEEGLYDEEVEGLTLDIKESEYTKQGLKSRRAIYK